MTGRLLLLLGALTALGPLAIDLYLPSFSRLAEVFITDPAEIQLSLAAYFVGLALGQLCYGPLLDRYGRRLPTLAGLVLFTVASLACALADSLAMLLVLRFIQALGGGVGLVASRAIVRDLCDPSTTARVFSRLMLVMGLAPILAPLLGGALLEHFDWPAIFVVLGAIGGLCIWGVIRGLPDTHPHSSRSKLLEAGREYRAIWRSPEFLGYALTGGLAMAGMFAYIAGSPYVFLELYEVPAGDYGWLFAANAAGFILTAQLNAHLLRHRPPAHWLRHWVHLYFGSALILLGVAVWQPAQLWPLCLPLFFCIASLGGIMPNATACALVHQGQRAGSASALLGSLQFAIAALAALGVNGLHTDTAQPLALLIVLCGFLAHGALRWTQVALR